MEVQLNLCGLPISNIFEVKSDYIWLICLSQGF